MLILVPEMVHDIFTLTELLNWVVFKALPLGGDHNLDYEVFENPRSVSASQMYEHAENMELGEEPSYPNLPSPDLLKAIAKEREISPQFFEACKIVYEKYERDMAVWNEAQEQLLEPAKSQIFVHLKSGKLPAYGRLARTLGVNAPVGSWKTEDGELWEEVPSHPKEEGKSVWDLKQEAMASGAVEVYEEAEKLDSTFELSRKRFEEKLQSIQPSFWRLEGIDWQYSRARSPQGWYEDIIFYSKDVFGIFALPERKSVTFQTFAGFVLAETKEANENITHAKRGRPPKIDWHSFDVEVARIMNSQEGLPQKQEALIVMMQEWCIDTWGRTPQRSTILERLSPFYKAVGNRKSENA